MVGGRWATRAVALAAAVVLAAACTNEGDEQLATVDTQVDQQVEAGEVEPDTGGGTGEDADDTQSIEASESSATPEDTDTNIDTETDTDTNDSGVDTDSATEADDAGPDGTDSAETDADPDPDPERTATTLASESGSESASPDGGSAAAGPNPAETPSPDDLDVADAVGDILTDNGDELGGKDLERHIAERFEAFWLAFDLARSAPSTSPETDYPALAELAAGQQLELAFLELKELTQAGLAIREPGTPAVAGLDPNTSIRIRVDAIDGGVAELTSCVINDQVRYEPGSGAIVSEAVRTVMASSTMAKAEGTWRLIDSRAVALDDGIGGCWLEGEDSFPY